MASTLIQFRTEDTEKIKSIQILDKLGLTLPAYLKMCMSRLNQEQGIPFSMKLDSIDTPGISAIKKTSKIAEEYNISDMSPDEINAEIAEARKEL
jgi:toxin-antitoxin system, antitoxin component, ribbon-helix-helix domain protein